MCIFSCEVELNIVFVVLFPRVTVDEYKGWQLFCSVVSVVFLLKFKSPAAKWELFF